MEYNTSRFGTIVVDDDNVIELRGAILGFDDLSKFVVLPHRDGASPFAWLQSLEDPQIAFVICQAQKMIDGYKPSPDEEIINSLAIEHNDLIVIYNIVRFLDGGKKPIVNLRAPIFLNSSKKLALQAILDDTHPLRYDFLSRKAITSNDCQR